ncbi:MAG: hypothetical protein WA728_06580 [Xanthobacteraceae bacterium]
MWKAIESGFATASLHQNLGLTHGRADMTRTKNTALIALAMIALTCASAQAQQPANEQQPCFEIALMQNAGSYSLAPLGSLRINKCTGETWQLRASPEDNNGMYSNRWYPLTVETRERFLHDYAKAPAQ